jgi:hypothetical protein
MLNASSQNHFDSIKGFDEEQAKRQAISEGFSDSELNSKLLRMKRDFPGSKYKQGAAPVYFPDRILSPESFPNEDFELSPAGAVTGSAQVNGWICSQGNNLAGDNCNLLGCCGDTSISEIAVISASAGVIDPIIGIVYPIYSVFGASPNTGTTVNPGIITSGNNFIRINSSYNNNSISRLSKTFSVTAGNAILDLAYISVFATGHSCCDGSAFIVRVWSANTNSYISCPSFSTASPGSGCYSVSPYYVAGTGAVFNGNNGSYVYSRWRIVDFDFSAYMGDVLTLEIISSDCLYGGHYGYSYVDARFSASPLPLVVLANNTPYQMVGDTFNVGGCLNASLSGPGGYNCLWEGPNGFSTTATSFTPSSSASFTLTLFLGPNCTIKKYVNYNLAIDIPTSVSSPSVCYGGTIAIATTPTLSFYFWNVNVTTSSFVVTPSVGVSTYSFYGYTGDGCYYDGYATVYALACAGLNELTNSKNPASVFPNPNKGEFIIDVPDADFEGEVRIYDLRGELLFRRKISSGRNELNIGAIPPSLYQYAILREEKIISRGKIGVE